MSYVNSELGQPILPDYILMQEEVSAKRKEKKTAWQRERERDREGGRLKGRGERGREGGRLKLGVGGGTESTRERVRAQALSDFLVLEIQKGNTFVPDLSVLRSAQLCTRVGGTVRFLPFYQ